MDKWLAKAGLLLFVLAFGVFYGVDTANRGIERTYGPMADSAPPLLEREGDPAARERLGVVMDHRERMSGLEQNGTQTEAQTEEPSGALSSGAQYEISQSAFSRLLGWIGSLLHALADGLIRLVVDLGESLLTGRSH